MITWAKFEQMVPEEYNDMLRKVLHNKEAMEGDVWMYLYGEDYLEEEEIICDYSEAGRWTVPVTIIFRFEGKFYSIWYNRGLTEMQDNEWDTQVADEVRLVETVRQEWQLV